MFDWRNFFNAMVFFSVLILIAGILSFGLYLLCETGTVWGFALIVGCAILGASIAVGFGL